MWNVNGEVIESWCGVLGRMNAIINIGDKKEKCILEFCAANLERNQLIFIPLVKNHHS
jgi:hypothetical protein